ncbi:PAS domain-containing sensor histidine kinase [Thiohalorhabdus sp. Cl-TMA]|uniref:histidine kinase n=1 Tax=Thiohalorhabdus methylotrophus TaxID=3242694 RepID=A0ABV4TUB7_9GAMM
MGSSGADALLYLDAAARELRARVAREDDERRACRRGLELIVERLAVPCGVLLFVDDPDRADECIQAGAASAAAGLPGLLRDPGILHAPLPEAEVLSPERLNAGPGSARAARQSPSPGSLLALPLLLPRDGEGRIYLPERTDGSPFTAEDLAFANQLGIAFALSLARRPLPERRAVPEESFRPRVAESGKTAIPHAHPGRRSPAGDGECLGLLLDQVCSAVIATDTDMRITFWNRHAEHLYQWRAKEVLGRSIFEVTVPEVSETEARAIMRVVDEQGSWDGEYAVRRKDGTRFPARVVNTKLRDSAGEPLGYVGVSLDITAFKRAESALQESEARYRALYERSRDAIMIWDASNSRFTAANPATLAMFGAREEADITALDPEALSPVRQPDGRSSAAKARELIDMALESGGHFFEWTHRRLDGTLFPATVQLTRMELDGRVWLKATVRDITEQRRAEETAWRRLLELAHVARISTMGEMATQMAHELHQPLTAVRNYSSIARSLLAEDAPPPVREALERLDHQARHAAQLVRRVRDFVRQPGCQWDNFDFNAVLEEVLILAGLELEAHGAELEARWGEDLPPVWGCAILIQQVALNLLRNAAEALGELADPDRPRRIILETRRRPGGVEMAVHDTGPGLGADPEVVFTPFWTSKTGGMGMGLRISRSILEQHGSTLRAESGREGGATFRFTLPVREAGH